MLSIDDVNGRDYYVEIFDHLSINVSNLKKTNVKLIFD